MNKKLLAVAVAGVLAAPAAALAQSSVTISGYVKGSFDHVSVSGGTNATAATTRTGNKSENRVTDHSSRIIFNMVEDLGGGLQAIGQFDLRFKLDQIGRTSNSFVQAAGVATTPSVNPLDGGNNHIGLRSKTWGTIKLGRQDTHYGNAGDTIPARAGHLGAYNSSVFDCVQRPGIGQNCIANLSRTANLVWYDSPKFGGIFELTVGYSTGGTRVSTTPEYENDLGTNARKGSAWTINPKLDGRNWHLSWSHWNSKSDWTGLPAGVTLSLPGTPQAGLNAVNDEKADSIRGHYIWGGLRAGLAWNKSKTKAAVTGVETGNRTAWAIPVSFVTGPHTFYMTYTKANDSKDTTVPGNGSGTGARLIAIAYNYDLSKRTSIGVTYANLRNRVNGAYNLFYQGDSAFGGTNGGSTPGEDWKLWGLGMRHNF